MADHWIDLAPHPDGGFVTAESLDRAVRFTLPTGTTIIREVPTDFLRYLDLAVSAAGQIAAIGQGGEGLAWVVTATDAPRSLGQTFGQQPVALRFEGETLHTYRCGPGDGVPLYVDGVERLRTHAVEGIRDVLPDGTIVFGQATAAAVFNGRNFGQFTRKQGWIVGQSGFSIACLREASNHFFTARRGPMAEGVHFDVAANGDLAVCALTEAGAYVQIFAPPYPANEPLTPVPVPIPVPPKPPKPPSASMQLPESVKAIRSRYVAAFPVPQGEPGDAFEERARQWSIRFAEQVAFEIPDQGYGMKRADQGRPISKDTLARWAPPGALLIWDLLAGTGTGKPSLVQNPSSQDVTGQTFVAVTPTNHLRAVPAPKPPDTPGTPQPPAVDLSDILKRLAKLEGPRQVAIKTNDGHYVCAESGGGEEVNATRTGVGGWETFTLEPRP